MNDLLSSKSLSVPRSRNYVDLKREGLPDLEMGDMAGMDTQQSLAGFYNEVGVIKNDMEKVREYLVKLEEANEESKTTYKAHAMKALRERMDEDVGEVLKKAKSIKAKLEDLDKANVANRRYPGCGEGTPTDRSRTSVTNGLRKNLKDLMGDFQILRQKIKEEHKEAIERRYYTVTGNRADEQTIERLIETGESENLLQKAIQEQGRAAVMDTIREIHERHDAVKEIEKSLLELHQIFLDMAVLVEAQGESLNNIEHQVKQSASFVDKGRQHLQEAKHFQNKSRKCMCVGVLIIALIILILIIYFAKN